MSVIVWNCHGFGNLSTGKKLEGMVQAKDTYVMFIAKTWADEARLKEIHNIDFENLLSVERNNRGGGLALYWKNSFDLHIDTFSKNHIDAIINKGKDEAWRFIGFYGELVTHK